MSHFLVFLSDYVDMANNHFTFIRGKCFEFYFPSLLATYLPQLSLHLEDRDGQLYESKDSKFFQVGKDITATSLKWKGIFKVIPRSLVGNSEIIMKQTKQEMANMLIPLLQLPPEIGYKPARQLCKINEEDERDWLPDLPGWDGKPVPPPMPMDEMGNPIPQEGMEEEQPLFVEKEEEQPLFVPKEAETLVPKGEVSSPDMKQMQGGGLGSLFRK